MWTSSCCARAGGSASPRRARRSRASNVIFSMEPIGVARTPYTKTAQVPKGPGAQHDAEGVLEILPQFELGLTDIEGFSHLYVLWVFDRASPCELLGGRPIITQTHG